MKIGAGEERRKVKNEKEIERRVCRKITTWIQVSHWRDRSPATYPSPLQCCNKQKYRRPMRQSMRPSV